MNRSVLIGVGTLSGVGLVLFGFSKLRAKQRDKKALKSFAKLRMHFEPTSSDIIQAKAFDTDWWKKAPQKAGQPIIRLTADAVKKYAKKISDAWGILNDDEDQIYWVFEQKLKDQVQVSQVAEQYEKNNDIALELDLQNKLKKDEWGRILKAVNKMKAYRKI